MTLDRTPGTHRPTWNVRMAGTAVAIGFTVAAPCPAEPQAFVSPVVVEAPRPDPGSSPADDPLAARSRLRSTLETRHEPALGSRVRVPPPPTMAPRGTRSRSIGRKVIAGVLGGVGGFFVGGMVGAAIEGNSCACDDPGLKGAVIGAPIGAVTGAFLAVKLAGR